MYFISVTDYVFICFMFAELNWKPYSLNSASIIIIIIIIIIINNIISSHYLSLTSPL